MAQEQVKEAQAGREHDPSIEDILASIQQIIAEGDGSADRRDEEDGGDKDEPLTLTERLPELGAEPAATAGPEIRAPEEEIAVAFAPDPEPEAESARELEAGPAALLTPATEYAARGALARLASHMAVARAPGRTLEDITHDLLAPMLREWLDANLPALIERLVREEIGRITRHAG